MLCAAPSFCVNFQWAWLRTNLFQRISFYTALFSKFWIWILVLKLIKLICDFWYKNWISLPKPDWICKARSVTNGKTTLRHKRLLDLNFLNNASIASKPKIEYSYIVYCHSHISSTTCVICKWCKWIKMQETIKAKDILTL